MLIFIVCFVVSITVSIAVLKEMLGRICAASRTLLINLDWYIKSWRIKLLFWSYMLIDEVGSIKACNQIGSRLLVVELFE